MELREAREGTKKRQTGTQRLHVISLGLHTGAHFPPPYLSVAPQLVPLHAVAVVQGDGAVVGDGVEADFLSVHGVAHPDVLPPAEREHLQETTLSCNVTFFLKTFTV